MPNPSRAITKGFCRYGRVCASLVAVLALCSAPAALRAEADYEKAVEGNDLVRNKLFPRKNKFELNAPSFGAILNQSYIDTFIIGGGATYHFNDEWGANVDFLLGINKDKVERQCIENFYNDPNRLIDDVCMVDGKEDAISNYSGSTPLPTGTTFGPAYVPIREIQYVAAAHAVWTPVYGKQLFLMQATSYFDLFTQFGLAVVGSKFYPQTSLLRDDRASKGQFARDGSQPEGGESKRIGAKPSETDLYGIEGRPDVLNQTNVALSLGLGQKFHFFKLVSLKFEARYLALVGTPSGFEGLFLLHGGLGFRF